MGEGDLFQMKGAEISKANEADFSGQDVLENSTIKLKISKPVVEKPVVEIGETPKPPSTSGLTGSDKPLGLKPDAGVSGDPTESAIKPDAGTATTDNEVEYINLSTADRKKLFDRLQLSKAIKLTLTGFEKCFPYTITWQQEPYHLVPENTLRVDKSFSFSKTIHELRKRGVQNVKASGGGFGVAVSAEYKKEKESLSRQETTTAYLLTTYDVPKIKLSIPVDRITVSRDFENNVRKAIAITDSTAGYFELLNVLNQYGFYVPTVFTLGGQIYAEDTKHIQSTVEAETETEAFAVALEANLMISGVPVKVGGGYGQSNSTEETNARLNAARAIQKNVRGGDPAKSNDSAPWIASLGPYSRWAVMEYVELTPTIKFLNPLDRAKCAKLINQHFLSGQTQKKTVVDMGSYATSLIEEAAEDF